MKMFYRVHALTMIVPGAGSIGAYLMAFTLRSLFLFSLSIPSPDPQCGACRQDGAVPRHPLERHSLRHRRVGH